MPGDSYTLREVADLLGVSKRTLQRRIQEGAFPGRFLAAGRHGLEMRIPIGEVEQAMEELRGSAPWRPAPGFGEARGHVSSHGAPLAGRGRPPQRAPVPSNLPRRREYESLVPYEQPELVGPSSSSPGSSALTQSDLESLRDAMLAMVREDREMFLSAIRDALLARDQEITGLRQELTSMRRVVEGVRGGLESLERRITSRPDAGQAIDPQVWADLLTSSVPRAPIDVEGLLREIGELESMLGPK